MLLTFTLILLLVLLSRFFEDRFKLPFALSAILLAYLANSWFDLSFLGNEFPEIVYLMLPIILIPDVLGVSRSELRHNMTAILYLSIFAVLVSIAIAMGITFLVAPQYHLTIGMMLALFAPLMATDVVSVSSIFGKFKLPEKLKLYAEGESLFNDITAMIIFFFIALPLLQGNEFNAGDLHFILGKMFFESLAVGIVAGIVGYYVFKYFNDSFEQFLTIYIMASMAFIMGENLHASGILGVVVAILLFKYLFDKEGHYKKVDTKALYEYLNAASTSEGSFRAYRKEAHYFGLFANGVIFIAIASIVDLALLWQYRYEILAVFLLTTSIRFFVIAPLIIIQCLPFRWTGALTLAGMKGGLAIIMAFALPDSFIYKEMFMAIVVGVVILSMFVNTAVLTVFLKKYESGFILDKTDSHNQFTDKDARKKLKAMLEKDADSQAYNVLVFEDMIEKEIARAQRYLQPFALLAFENEDAKQVGDRVFPLLRRSDYFGKLDDNRYAVLATHSDVDAAMIVAQKLQQRLDGLPIAVAEYSTGDTIEMMYDKIEVAFKSGKPIDIEV